MTFANLYSDLISRGVSLSLNEQMRLRIEAPFGALTPALRDALYRHRDELAQFIFELEERAALMFGGEDLTREELQKTRERARDFIPFGRANCDGFLYLKELAESNPDVQEMLRVFKAKIVSVCRITGNVMRAA